MKLIIIILIAALLVSSVAISIGFLTSEKYIDIPEISDQYEKLSMHKNDLENINQYNQQILKDLEVKINSSDDVNLDQIYEEIEIVKQVIEDNKSELENVITKLSQMESNP